MSNRMIHVCRSLFTRAMVFSLALVLSSCGYNIMVKHQDLANNAWSDVENQSGTLIDIAAEMVENGTDRAFMNNIREARQQAVDVLYASTPTLLNQQTVSRFENAQLVLLAALDSYATFLRKDGTENISIDNRHSITDLDTCLKKLKEAALNYNAEALKYNTIRKKTVHVFMASIAGFKPKGYFLKLTGKK